MHRAASESAGKIPENFLIRLSFRNSPLNLLVDLQRAWLPDTAPGHHFPVKRFRPGILGRRKRGSVIRRRGDERTAGENNDR